jgi:transcriptional regulator with XRE-family HTH domain
MAEQDGPSTPLGDFIRTQRELSDLSMRQFAEMAGISNPYLSQIERGHREPSRRVLDAIARSFEMSVDALFAQAGIKPEREPQSTRVREAVEADPDLRPKQRRALLEIYEDLRSANRAASADAD